VTFLWKHGRTTEETFIKECCIGVLLLLSANISPISMQAGIRVLFMLVIRYLGTVHKEKEGSSRNSRQ